MILLAVYAVFVWFLAMRWRRRWYGFVSVWGLGGLFWLAAPLIRSLSPDWHGMNLLIQGETVLILASGTFICLLPRPPAVERHCRTCWYDLSGLEPGDPGSVICPECGAPVGGEPAIVPRYTGPRPRDNALPPDGAVEHAEHQHSAGNTGDEQPPQRGDLPRRQVRDGGR